MCPRDNADSGSGGLAKVLFPSCWGSSVWGRCWWCSPAHCFWCNGASWGEQGPRAVFLCFFFSPVAQALVMLHLPALPDTQCKPSAILGFFDIKTSVASMFLMNFSCGCLPPHCNGYCFKQRCNFMLSELVPHFLPVFCKWNWDADGATLVCLTSSPWCSMEFILSALYRSSIPHKASLQKHQEQIHPVVWPGTGTRTKCIWRNLGSTAACREGSREVQGSLVAGALQLGSLVVPCPLHL